MNKAVFLDRDGVINAALYNATEDKLDSPYRLEDFRLLPGVPQAIRAIHQMGFFATVVSNQPGVAKGKCDFAFIDRINRMLQTQLAEQDARLDAIYYCFHHPEAQVEELRFSCDCRKPKPGLLLRAAHDLQINLVDSYIVGDNMVDILAGEAAGCRTVLLKNSFNSATEYAPVATPDIVEKDLLSAVTRIRSEVT